jgi:Na+-transporting NADH:ubiquinone oxidoreductase subunit B
VSFRPGAIVKEVEKKVTQQKNTEPGKLSPLKPLSPLSLLGFGPNLPKKFFMIQPLMMKVVYGLVPCMIASIYFFGFRALMITAVVLAVGIVTEGMFTLRRGKPITSAVFVTCLIFSLSLPPTIPVWMAVVGIIFGVAFGKMVFGGFGYNVYNPAMVGRCFLYITFPIALTNDWVDPFWGQYGGFTNWAPGVDAVTGATPLVVLRAGNEVPLENLLIGNISGSLGETSALLILIGGIYIVAVKSAPWRLAVSCLIGGLLMAITLRGAGVPSMPNPIAFLMAGSFLFGAFFVVTEPVSGPKTKEAQWIYGFIIGALTIVLRIYGNFSEGIMFCVLFMNTFVSVLDMGVKSLKQRRKTSQLA